MFIPVCVIQRLVQHLTQYVHSKNGDAVLAVCHRYLFAVEKSQNSKIRTLLVHGEKPRRTHVAGRGGELPRLGLSGPA